MKKLYRHVDGVNFVFYIPDRTFNMVREYTGEMGYLKLTQLSVITLCDDKIIKNRYTSSTEALLDERFMHDRITPQ